MVLVLGTDTSTVKPIRGLVRFIFKRKGISKVSSATKSNACYEAGGIRSLLSHLLRSSSVCPSFGRSPFFFFFIRGLRGAVGFTGRRGHLQACQRRLVWRDGNRCCRRGVRCRQQVHGGARGGLRRVEGGFGTGGGGRAGGDQGTVDGGGGGAQGGLCCVLSNVVYVVPESCNPNRRGGMYCVMEYSACRRRGGGG